jgi:hypothetical protein
MKNKFLLDDKVIGILAALAYYSVHSLKDEG